MSTRFQNAKKQTKSTPKTTKADPKAEDEQNLTKKKEMGRRGDVKSTSRSRTSPKTSSSSPFYPNKEAMYKNALKENKSKVSKERDRNKTRTLSPSEVKVLKKKEEPSTSNAKRPGTATIKKPQKEEEEIYESDFDSYQSDFEEYQSSSISSEEDIEDVKCDKTTVEVEEERKLDSGNYEITETNKHKQVLSNIVESAESEGNKNVSNLTSLSDEGFEELKNERVHFVNFAEAKRRNSQIKTAEIKKKRGQELMGMLHLDNQNFTIFEMQAIPYDIFMKSYGNRNYIQSSIQTGDDNIDEEVSTEEVEVRTIWTQYPTKLDTKNLQNLKLYQKDFLGFGCIEENDLEAQILKYNEDNLICFLRDTSEVILTLMEEKSQQNTCRDIENNDKSLPFSDGRVTFNTNLDFLKDSKVCSVAFSENTTKILTVHNSVENSRCLLCLWKISDQNKPEKIFSVYGRVNCCHLNNESIFAGLHDGSVSIWKINNIDLNSNNDYVPPIFMSSVQKAHESKIISIVSIENLEETDQNNDKQVYTLSEGGLLIIWTIIELQKRSKLEINLHVNAKINFKETFNSFDNLQCTDMAVNKLDPTHIFVSTNYGSILHFITTGKKSHPKYYADKDSRAISNCVTNCPFSPLYFLSGYESGNVMLFSRQIEKPLMVMSNTNQEIGIDFVEWSINKPCTFYTKDTKNTIHIWDLTKSDIFPIYSTSFKENINFIKLSPGISQNNAIKRSYMVIITDDNTVGLYVLNKEHGQQDTKEYEDNIRKFSNYVRRL